MSTGKVKLANEVVLGYAIKQVANGLSIYVQSPWLEKLFRVISDNRVFKSRSSLHHDKLFYMLCDDEGDDLLSGWNITNRSNILKKSICVYINQYGSSLKYIGEDTWNLSFLRTVGLSKGIAFNFPGVHSEKFVAVLEEFINRFVCIMYNKHSSIVPFTKDDTITSFVPVVRRGKSTRASNTRVKDYIYLVGVELEGGWSKVPPAISEWRYLGEDGSINHINEDKFHIGELRSRPMSPSLISKWIRANLPQESNDSCGLHVHMSMSDNHYSALMREDFHKSLVSFFTKWGKEMRVPKDHPFWDRLEGGNDYCMKEFSDPDLQAEVNDHDDCRYYQINFCRKLHGTVEFRFLPMWSINDARFACSAVTELIELVRSYIRHNEPPSAVNIISISNIKKSKAYKDWVPSVETKETLLKRVKLHSVAKKITKALVPIDGSEEADRF